MTIRNIGFLASHRGSNMQSIIDACSNGRLQGVPAVVISNNSDSGALDRARQHEIPAYHLSSKQYSDSDVLDHEICKTLLDHKVDLVVLAGYMKKVGPHTLKAFKGRIINIHPALLPKYGGKGMYGSRVHEQVLASGDTETGVTIHIVTDDYDTGPIIAQEKVPVKEDDTVESLADRVIVKEHELYVATIDRIIRGEIPLGG